MVAMWTVLRSMVGSPIKHLASGKARALSLATPEDSAQEAEFDGFAVSFSGVEAYRSLCMHVFRIGLGWGTGK